MPGHRANLDVAACVKLVALLPPPTEESSAVAKDKGSRKGNDKTPASKTLKEKRAAKKSKGKATI